MGTEGSRRSRMDMHVRLEPSDVSHGHDHGGHPVEKGVTVAYEKDSGSLARRGACGPRFFRNGKILRLNAEGTADPQSEEEEKGFHETFMWLNAILDTRLIPSFWQASVKVLGLGHSTHGSVQQGRNLPVFVPGHVQIFFHFYSFGRETFHQFPDES